MNLAVLIPFGFSTSIHKIGGWLPWRKGVPNRPTSASPAELTPTTPTMERASSPEADSLCALHRPLRVVHVLEAGQPRSHVGRMVISGCMADVCAELDRLVAREASLS